MSVFTAISTAALLLFLLQVDAVQAQGGVPGTPAKNTVRWPDRPRYLDGRFSITLLGGMNKYFGEFSGNEVGPSAGIQLRYSLLRFLDFGIGAEAGILSYTRRNRRNLGITYPYQFGEANMLPRSTEAAAGEAWFRLNLFPASRFNAWALFGGGYALLRPEDYRNGDAAFPGEETIGVLSIPLGGGVEWHLTRSWSVQLGAMAHLVMSGEMDAFDSGDLVQKLQVSQGLPSNPDREKTANDTWLSVSVGLTWHLFDDSDFDGDGVSNFDEAEAGTNPYDADSDGDGLTDHEELRIYFTNPLYWDTDRDVLSDYVEVTRYKTDPTKKDSDGDGLDDRDELLDYQTDPLSPDTEGDGLIDSEEKRLGCHPKKVDTDGDGLYDGDEVIIYHTNPVLPDSDGEGINDNEEVRVHRTDPNLADTDKDGLTDYEELRLFHTDPLKADTDGDGISDYEELRRFGTDPLTPSTAKPSVPSNRRGG